DLRKEKGYYAVGGCGANIAWHTEDDTLEIADRDNLLRDIKVYAAVVLRSLNAPVHPFDYRAAVDDLRRHVERYADAATSKAALADGDDMARVIAIHLTRGQNRLVWACRSAEQSVDRFLANWSAKSLTMSSRSRKAAAKSDQWSSEGE